LEGSVFTPLMPLTSLQPLAPIRPLESIGSLESAQDTKASSGFGQYLRDALDQINALQADANHKSHLLLTGDVEDFHTPIIALEKASLAMGLATSLRNKLLEAYQEIMRMQI